MVSPELHVNDSAWCPQNSAELCVNAARQKANLSPMATQAYQEIAYEEVGLSVPRVSSLRVRAF